MFCDLVGSTGLAARLDPEDWRNLVNAYLDEASAAVTGLGGHVLKKLGDGLMALFGYPQAQENDAERAVRAALAIQRALEEINVKNRGKGAPELSARIGLECGPVVVEATGEVFGDAPNVAARVQAAAEPGSVFVTMNVQRQVAGLFVAEERGAQELKGLSEPVQLFRIVRASGGGRRGGARTLTPFVGREEELGVLARRWERAKGGEGQLVLIVGEPGLGKSRLIEEFRAQLTVTPHTWSEWSASQLLQNTPLHPIAEWGRQRFGVEAPAERRLADLESTLRLVGLDPARIRAPARAARGHSTAARARGRLRARGVAAKATRGDDRPGFGWGPGSAGCPRLRGSALGRSHIARLAARPRRPRRPSAAPPPGDRPSRVPPALEPALAPQPDLSLAPGSCRRRAHGRRDLGQHALSKDVIEGVSERTGGVPLFVEEVTRLLLERGEQGGVQAIPPTLQQSLAARLDRLGPAREVAQIGAVLGRDFAYPLLHDVSELDEPALQASLDRLADADLLFVEGAPPQASYRFKHALIQDAAYDSLFKSRRQALHRRAAELLRDDPERAAAEPEVIAHHFTQAVLDDLAIEWWGKAGDQALRRSAFQEAIAHLGRAIAMADKADGTTSRETGDASGRRLKLQTDYGQAVMWSKGFAAEETKAALAREAELAASARNFSARFAALQGQFRVACTAGELRHARELALTLLREAEEAGEVEKAGIQADHVLGSTAYWQADFVEARSRCTTALAACDAGPDSMERGVWRTLATSFLALTFWQLGEIGRGRELIDGSAERTAKGGRVPEILEALFYKSYFELWRDDPMATLSAAEALAAVARAHGVSQYLHEAEMHLGWAQGRTGDPAAGAAQIQRVLATFVEQHVRVNLGFYTGLLAELEAETLGPESALARVDEAFGLSNQVELRCSLPFLRRLRGNILLKHEPANPAPAEEAFKTAIAIATEQSARSPRLQAALALGKLYRSTGRPAEAHDVLAPALEGFSPTPEMPEIAEAQSLLAALAESEEVKSAEAQRQRRLHLQTAYGQAKMYSRGYGSEKSKTAFARARTLAAGVGDASERFDAYYGLFASSMMRGELGLARETAESFLRDAENAGRMTEAGAARRGVGLAGLYQGDFVGAAANLAEALRTYDPERDRDAKFRSAGIPAPAQRASSLWRSGRWATSDARGR